MTENGKHINNWDLPEHKPKPGLWQDIEKILDKPIAATKGLKDSLETLPQHRPYFGLWYKIEKQLVKSHTPVFLKTIFKYTVPVVLFLTGLFVYDYLVTSNKKPPVNSNSYKERPENTSVNTPGIFERNPSDFTLDEKHATKKEELAIERVIEETDLADKIFNKTQPISKNTIGNNPENILPDNGNLKVWGGMWQKNHLSFSLINTKNIHRVEVPFLDIKEKEIVLQRNSDFTLKPKYFKDSNNVALRKFFFGIYYMPEFIYNKNGNIEIKRASNTGISLGYKFSNIFIESGLGFSFTRDDGAFEIDYLQNELINTYTKVDSIIYFLDTSGNEPIRHYVTSNLEVYDSIEHTEGTQTINRYTYLQIPLLLGYKNDFQKISLLIKAGTVFSILIQGNEPVPTVNGKEITVINIDRLSPGRITTNWQILLSAGLGIPVYKTLRLTLEPQYCFYLNSNYTQQMKKYKKPYSFGVRAGLLFNF